MATSAKISPRSPMRAAAFALSFANDAQISGGILSKIEQVGPPDNHQRLNGDGLNGLDALSVYS